MTQLTKNFSLFREQQKGSFTTSKFLGSQRTSLEPPLIGITIWTSPSRRAPLIPSRGIQLFVGARGTANLKRNERERRARPSKELSRSQFIRLKRQVISTQRREIGRGWGGINKEQRSGHLLTWGPKSGARQRALCILSPEHRSSLTALGVKLGSGVTHVLGWHGNSGRDREEGTIIQLLQPQVPRRE